MSFDSSLICVYSQYNRDIDEPLLCTELVVTQASFTHVFPLIGTKKTTWLTHCYYSLCMPNRGDSALYHITHIKLASRNQLSDESTVGLSDEFYNASISVSTQGAKLFHLCYYLPCPYAFFGRSSYNQVLHFFYCDPDQLFS